MSYLVTPASLYRAKSIARKMHPQIKPTHIVEILAAGFGCNTYAALKTKIDEAPTECDWSDVQADRRADAIGAARLVANFAVCTEVRSLGVLRYLDSWQIERIAHIAARASQEHDELLPRSGKVSNYMKRREELESKGAWPTPLQVDHEQQIRKLSPEQLFEVQAVMWVRREQYTQSQWEWAPIFAHAENTHNDNSYAYVLGKGNLGIDLQIGLQMLAGRFIPSVGSALVN